MTNEGAPQEESQFDGQPQGDLGQPTQNPGDSIQPETLPYQDDSESSQMPEEDGRWDNRKAAVLGNVLIDEPESEEAKTLKTSVKERDDDLAFADNWVKDGNRILGETNAEIEAGNDNVHTQKFKKELEEGIAHSEKRLVEVPKEAREKVLKTLSPYEELYDLNPDHFAEIPTSEFMATAGELKALDEALGKQEDQLDSLHAELDLIIERDKGTQALTDDEVTDIELTATGVISREGEEAEEALRARFEKIKEDSYDLTPRQRAEKYREIYEELIGNFAEQSDLQTKKRVDFLNQFKPHEESQAGGEEQQDE